MNIFILDSNIETCARYHVDSHVVKQILEYSQLLSTAHRVLDTKPKVTKINNRKATVYTLNDERDDVIYKATHINHPCSIWVRQSKVNYLWLLALLKQLHNEYTYRYGKIHASSRILPYLEQLPKNIPDINNMTPFALAMPDEFKTKDPVESYRNYYNGSKQRLFSWKKREQPYWIIIGNKI